ncbi:hypothetical protein Taro_011783 [Colocasia esculenta]|uniref:Uncharacterized protein n=1 Tax=Colocasia esculenta TaxID=4460 RepID=A0A843U7A5_COLES|nr:hypothetical protein [Colocasia esculenta]
MDTWYLNALNAPKENGFAAGAEEDKQKEADPEKRLTLEDEVVEEEKLEPVTPKSLGLEEATAVPEEFKKEKPVKGGGGLARQDWRARVPARGAGRRPRECRNAAGWARVGSYLEDVGLACARRGVGGGGSCGSDTKLMRHHREEEARKRERRTCTSLGRTGKKQREREKMQGEAYRGRKGRRRTAAPGFLYFSTSMPLFEIGGLCVLGQVWAICGAFGPWSFGLFVGFEEFHRKYYHPSNARIWFYGDDDPNERLCILSGSHWVRAAPRHPSRPRRLPGLPRRCLEAPVWASISMDEQSERRQYPHEQLMTMLLPRSSYTLLLTFDGVEKNLPPTLERRRGRGEREKATAQPLMLGQGLRPRHGISERAVVIWSSQSEQKH